MKIISLLILCACLGCKEQPVDYVSVTQSRRKVVELTQVPDGIRCFTVINPDGYMVEALSCFPKSIDK